MTTLYDIVQRGRTTMSPFSGVRNEWAFTKACGATGRRRCSTERRRTRTALTSTAHWTIRSVRRLPITPRTCSKIEPQHGPLYGVERTSHCVRVTLIGRACQVTGTWQRHAKRSRTLMRGCPAALSTTSFRLVPQVFSIIIVWPVLLDHYDLLNHSDNIITGISCGVTLEK